MAINCIKKLRNTKKYQIIFRGNDGELEVVENCPYSDKEKKCFNCYGKVAKVSYQDFNPKTGKFEKKIIIKKNTYSNSLNKISEKLEANKIISECSIIREIQKKEQKNKIGRSTFLWTAYDRPETYKTDCKKCKQTHSNYPPCQQVEENRKKGLPDHFCAEQKQRKVMF